MNTTDLKKLLKKGKIRGYNVNAPAKMNDGKQIPQKKTKALAWLDLNLQYWCNERSLTLECAANGGEHRFDDERMWRFDYAISSIKVAVEFEGGIFMQSSGHNTAKHYTKDTDKYNRAAALGWTVIRVTALNYSTALTQLNLIYEKHIQSQ